MIETRRLKNVVIFVQTILSFVLSRKIINIYNDIARKYGNIYNCCSISNDPKYSIGRAYIQMVMDERITLMGEKNRNRKY